jgi:hypothetical protein
VPGILPPNDAAIVGVETAGIPTPAADALLPSGTECGVAGTEPDIKLPDAPNSAHTVDNELFLRSV